jgi:hypothetical protein
MLTPEVVAKHMSTDANLIGMNEGQALAMMTSMFTLFQNLTQPQQQQAAAGSNDMQPTTTQPQPPQQQQQQQQGAKGSNNLFLNHFLVRGLYPYQSLGVIL